MIRSNMNSDLAKGYRIEIYPSESQKIQIDAILDLYRFVYNWALTKQNESYRNNNGYIQYFEMMKLFKEYRNNLDNVWLKKILVHTASFALKDADIAFTRFFKKISGYPKFKPKKNRYQSFKVRGDMHRIHFKGNYVSFENLERSDKWVYCGRNHHIPKEESKYYNVIISTDGYGKYFLSVTIEEKDKGYIIDNPNDPIGIDLGLKHLMTLDDGTVYDLPDTKSWENRISKIKRRVNRRRKIYNEQRAIAKSEGSNIPEKSKSLQKAETRLKRCYQKISNKNKNAIYESAKDIISRHPSAIVMENTRVKEIVANNKYISRFASSLLFYTTREIMEYKCKKNDIIFILADKDFPSSQICSCCGHKQKMPLSKRVYKCPSCGIDIDRDVNAAINLRNLAYSQ